jgi:hypothetical protein
LADAGKDRVFRNSHCDATSGRIFVSIANYI